MHFFELAATALLATRGEVDREEHDGRDAAHQPHRKQLREKARAHASARRGEVERVEEREEKADERQHQPRPSALAPREIDFQQDRPDEQGENEEQNERNACHFSCLPWFSCIHR